MNSPKIIKTEDGSFTLKSQLYNETYHSQFGAITESKCIFIDYGLSKIDNEPISVLEMGFGTGLNALLTLEYSLKWNKYIEYCGIEMHPIHLQHEVLTNYCENLHVNPEYFMQMHELEWNKKHVITSNFTFEKRNMDMLKFETENTYDILYFDAFSPDTQPELWTEAFFLQLYKALNKEGIFVTYSVKGIVKRALKNAGFSIEILPGPPGKRHVLRARKN